MAGNTPKGPLGFDPVAALNALDMAMGSQEAEAELARVVREFLPLVEAVETLGARLDGPADAEAAARAEGLRMLVDLCERIRTSLRLEPTATPGQPADKRKHEIVETVAGAPEDRGKIAHVVAQGWTCGGLGVRQAQVAVYTLSPAEDAGG